MTSMRPNECNAVDIVICAVAGEYSYTIRTDLEPSFGLSSIILSSIVQHALRSIVTTRLIGPAIRPVSAVNTAPSI